ncbi:hypothetical protein IPV08_12810 [Methylobacterium sp. SD274]|uniref:hypothetical protein n=1 Tax=Methylobacterium sp. SD274 TaxID=2782009 RepID=UPI001A972264|nr:hypothetical protein [Methylobacterium sp. SD274]MBO1020850.1 hypothetical protein [Methylobacterium sp. SD274]
MLSAVAVLASAIGFGTAAQAAPIAAAPIAGLSEDGFVTNVAGHCGLGYYPDRFTGRCRGNGSINHGAGRRYAPAYRRPYARPYGRPAYGRPAYRGY